MPTAHLYRLSPGEIWRYLHTQPASFWFLCIYLFFEYVRPQQLFPVIDVFPWTQATLILTVVTFFLEGNWFSVSSVATRWLLAFTVLVAASIYAAVYPDEGLKHINTYFVWVLVYLLIINIVITQRRYLVFLLAFLLYNYQMTYGAMRQWAGRGFGFSSWGLSGGTGWFANSGDFGVALCIFLPVSVYFAIAVKPYLTTKWKYWIVLSMPITALIAIIGSSSRGAVVGLAGIGIWMLVRSKRRLRAFAWVSVVAVFTYLALPAEQKQRFTEAGTDTTSVRRLTYWEKGYDIAKAHPWQGIGYSNWLRYYRQHVNIQGELPHNTPVLAMAEIGFPGLLLFLGLHVVIFVLNARTRRLGARDPTDGRFNALIARGLDGGLVGLFVSGLFDTVLWYPFFWLHLGLTVALYEVTRRKLAVVMPPQRAARQVVGAQRQALRA